MMDMSVSLLVGKIVPAVAALPALAPVRQSFYNVCFYESITLYNLNIWNLCLSKYIKILKMKKKWAALLQDSKFCRPHFLAFYEILILEFLYDILQLLILCQSVSSVAQSCPTLCSPMNRSTPGLPVYHQLPEFTQTHIHRVSDAIQPSHPLSFPSPPAPNPSQHHSLFQWVNSSHEVAKVLEFQL